MPAVAGAGAQTFQMQFQQFMFYAGPLVQIIFWVGLLLVATLAWLDLRRLVKAKIAMYDLKRATLGAPAEAGGKDKDPGKDAPYSAAELKVEEFVE